MIMPDVRQGREAVVRYVSCARPKNAGSERVTRGSLAVAGRTIAAAPKAKAAIPCEAQHFSQERRHKCGPSSLQLSRAAFGASLLSQTAFPEWR